MDTCFSASSGNALRHVPARSSVDAAQPYIYSFRCSQGMEESLSRIMKERDLNRTSVIRLALYALDCLARSREGRELTLAELVEHLEQMAPESGVSFADFIRGKGDCPNQKEPAIASACGGWKVPAATPATPRG